MFLLVIAAAALDGCGYRLGTAIPAPESGGDAPAGKKIDPRKSDYLLRDQNGKEVKLYSDLLKNKVVVITFFFTNCTTVCDLQGKHFVKLQTALGPRLGSEVNLLSISKDPENDTPEVLKQWSEKYGVKNGWTLLTGDLEEVKKTFIAFTGQGPSTMEHMPIILIGNTDTGKWARLNGLMPIEEILRQIENVK